MTRRRTAHEKLQRARESLARARASSADPWRIAELQLRHDEALAAALDAPDEVLDDDGPPRPAGPAPALALAWVDESTRRRTIP